MKKITIQEINKRAKEIDTANPLSISEMLRINMIKYKQELFEQARKELQAEEGAINRLK